MMHSRPRPAAPSALAGQVSLRLRALKDPINPSQPVWCEVEFENTSARAIFGFNNILRCGSTVFHARQSNGEAVPLTAVGEELAQSRGEPSRDQAASVAEPLPVDLRPGQKVLQTVCVSTSLVFSDAEGSRFFDLSAERFGARSNVVRLSIRHQSDLSAKHKMGGAQS